MPAIITSEDVKTMMSAANFAGIKTTLSLNNVQNTALTTWAGSTSLTTLGTIVTGIWNGTAITVARGGTGATTLTGLVVGNGTGAFTTITPGTGVATALAIAVGSAGAFVTFNGALGTPSGGVATNITGLPLTGLVDSVAGDDRIAFWDQSSGNWSELVVGAGLLITDSEITATGSGSGDMVGPASSTDNAIVLFDGATGKLVQNSVVIVDPTTGNMTGVGNITGGALAVTSAAPTANDGAPLGSATVSWSDLFLASGGVINWNNGNCGITHNNPGAFLLVNPGDLRITSANVGTNADSVPTLSSTSTLTNKRLELGESSGQIVLDAALSADGTYSGIIEAGTAGATLAFGDLIYLQAADSRWELADADAASTSGDVKLGICVLAAASDGSATTVLLFGKVRADTAFPTLTIGAPAYAGTTAGDIQTAQPSGTDDVIRVIGYGNTADELFFNPSGTYLTHT